MLSQKNWWIFSPLFRSRLFEYFNGLHNLFRAHENSWPLVAHDDHCRHVLQPIFSATLLHSSDMLLTSQTVIFSFQLVQKPQVLQPGSAGSARCKRSRLLFLSCSRLKEDCVLLGKNAARDSTIPASRRIIFLFTMLHHLLQLFYFSQAPHTSLSRSRNRTSCSRPSGVSISDSLYPRLPRSALPSALCCSGCPCIIF